MSNKPASASILDYIAALGQITPVFATCIGMLILVGDPALLACGLASLTLGVGVGIGFVACTEARSRKGWKLLASSVRVSDLSSRVPNGLRQTPYLSNESDFTCVKRASQAYTMHQEISMDERNDEELVRAWLTGDLKACDELTARYLVRVQNFHYARERDSSRAWDLTQETFFKILRNKHRLDPTKPFAAYLFRVAQNTGRSWFRVKARLSGVLVSLRDSDDRPGENNVENTLAVEEAVAKLPERHREVHELRMQGFTNVEIADILDISVRTVVSTNTEIHYRLRQSLTRPSGITPPTAPRTSPEAESID